MSSYLRESSDYSARQTLKRIAFTCNVRAFARNSLANRDKDQSRFRAADRHCCRALVVQKRRRPIFSVPPGTNMTSLFFVMTPFLLKGSVSCDNCRDDGTDLGTRSVQGTAL
jgi:hypothetical protein